jgi:hypothetical protein
MGLFAQPIKLGNLPSVYATMAALPDDSLAAVEEKRRQYQDLVKSTDYLSGRLLADAWCAAFVWKKTGEFDYPVTEEVFRALENNPRSQPAWMVEEIQRLAGQYHFFHWHLEFPDVFRVPAENEKPEHEQMGWSGGFDCVVGNPAWDVLQPEEEKFFAGRAAHLLEATTASERKKRLSNLSVIDPGLWSQWQSHCAGILRARAFIGESGHYPLTAYGKTNLYSTFTELSLAVAGTAARTSLIVPTGIATDEPNKVFMQHLLKNQQLISLFDFENKGLFPDVDSRFKFSVITIGAHGSDSIGFGSFLHSPADLRNEGRVFTLNAEDIALLNPNTRTCPVFASACDALLTTYIYRRVPAFQLLGEGPADKWKLRLTRLFMMDSDSGFFEDGSLQAWPNAQARLYESKMIHHFDHRHATFGGVTGADRKKGSAIEVPDRLPCTIVEPRYCVPVAAAEERQERAAWRHRWSLALRDITNATNERTVIACVVPREAAANNLPLVHVEQEPGTVASLCSLLSSFVVDYVARQKVGGSHINLYLLQQFPILEPECLVAVCRWADAAMRLGDWLAPRVLELAYTAWDLEAFGVDCGYAGPPFRWDEDRRFLLRAELDAAFFHLYLGTSDEWERDASPALKAKLPSPRHAVDHIMETFPIVKRKDIEAHGTYRTKDTILSIYDEMAEAIRTGKPYQTRLDPPPADPSCRHAESTRPSWAVPQS